MNKGKEIPSPLGARNQH